METHTIPTRADDVTADWLNRVTGWGVERIDIEEIGAGIGVSSAVYRITNHGGSGPASAVLKLNALDEAAVFTGMVLRFGRREVNFYDRLAARSPIAVPAGYHGAFADDDSSFAMLMEDLGGHRVVDQITGLSLEDVERCIDALADWHGTWWNDIDGLCEAGCAVALDDPLYPALLPGLFAEGWAKLSASEAITLPEVLSPIAERFGDAVAPMLASLSSGPTTLLHGDYRADNMMFSSVDGRPILFDFQIIGTGSPAFDFAYFVTQSLDASDAAEYEQALFDRWVAGLRTHGATDDELGVLWEHYRTAALFCLVYPVVAARGMDFDDPRQASLAQVMIERMARAVDDLDLASIIVG